MAYKILKPEIESVPRAVWSMAKKHWQFWVLSIIAVFFSLSVSLILFSASSTMTASLTTYFLQAVFLPLIFPLVYLLFLQNKLKSLFWKQVAEINKWGYQTSSDHSKESGVMFRQGNSLERNISNLIEGVVDGRPFRIFNYYFSVGGGKTRKVYFYTVFAFKFNGSFPHIYLNNKHNSYNISTGEKVSLSSEFEKKFTLFAPRKYEIEALEIFTPDVLLKILENNFVHDVEFVNQEVIIFADGIIHDFEKLEKEFNKALELEDLIDQKLDKFKFEKIGDMSHQLK